MHVATNQNPASAFVVDLQGGGHSDLLYEVSAVSPATNTVHTLLAQRSGGYSTGPITVLPDFVGNCRAADVNRDGKPDLICLDYLGACDAQIATLLGTGGGNFDPPILSGVMHSNCMWSTFYPSLYTPADINGDSSLDLVVGDAFNFAFFVLLGDGQGHFKVSFSPVTNSAVQFGGEVYVADLNGDGKADLIANVGPFVWLGNGDGTFRYGGQYGNYHSCNLYDIEASGHLDAICANLLTNNDSVSYVLDILHGNADRFVQHYAHRQYAATRRACGT